MINASSLDGIELFAKASPDDRRAIAALMTQRSYGANQPVVWVGDPGDEFFIIVKGTVEACLPDESGREIRIAVLGPGEFFGELALFDGGARSSTVRTLEPLDVLVLTHDAFHRCLREQPSIATQTLEVFGRRQRQLLERLRGIRNVNEIIEQKLTPWQRIAQFIAETAASRGFLLANASAYVGWIVLNSLLGHAGWDPYPFPFLCFSASVEAIFLSLFILVSQAMESQKDRLRNEQDYHVAVKMQYEIAQLHRKVDQLGRQGARP